MYNLDSSEPLAGALLHEDFVTVFVRYRNYTKTYYDIY